MVNLSPAHRDNVTVGIGSAHLSAAMVTLSPAHRDSVTNRIGSAHLMLPW